MSDPRLWLVLVTGLWLASIGVGGADPAPAVDQTLPDPFAHRPTPPFSVAIAAFLVAIAGGAVWLGRRRAEPREDVQHQTEGPHVVMPPKRRSRRRFPRFYEDLRRRETVLENLEERGSDRPRLKVIELPSTDGQSGEENS